jgi:signal transduction histidine kinase
VLATACGREARTPAEQWQRAVELWRWREQDVGAAFRAWTAIDPASAEGVEARRRLALAEVSYRRGIERLRSGAPGSREALVEGTAIAPMDPALYLPLARACRDRGLDGRAAEFYRKYLALAGAVAERGAAEAELGAIVDGEPELGGIFEPRRAPTPWWPFVVGAPLLVALAAAAIALARRRGPSLERRAAASPELHPALAYLIGCLRHELLKHRVGAVADVVRALGGETGSAPAHDEPPAPSIDRAQLEFLLARLYRGEPLVAAWRGHLGTFERALGPRFALERNERSFRRAGRALATLQRLEPALRNERSFRKAAARLERAHRELRRFDAELQALTRGLVRTRLDGVLLAEVARAVRAEQAAVPLDELTLAEVPDGIAVEVYRIDLIIILKNLLRNAVAAAGRGPAPRRVALDVAVEIEPTGEELVRVRVRDTSPEPLTPETIAEARLERGLGLVTAALERYQGALTVEPGAGGYTQAVVVKLFRALDGDGDGAREADAAPLKAAS